MYKTFTQLGFKAGDRVRCTKDHADFFEVGRTYTLGYDDGWLRVDTKHGCSGYYGEWELIEPIDMSNNRVPYSILTDEEKKALEDWDGEYEIYSYAYGEWLKQDKPDFLKSVVYRTVPKPKAISVSDLKGTVEMKDGKPDWSTYSED